MSPDIVILEEYNKDTDLVGLYTSYPYRADGEEGNLSISNTVILSKYPFASQESHPYMSSSLPSVEIIVSGTSVAIMGVHTMSPTSHERTIQWLSDLSEVGKWAVENKDKNIIIAGDFNANTSMKPFRDMVQIGELYITNKFIPTWGFESFKTGLIDNVLVSKNIQLKKIEVKDVVGSDHALTYVELQIP
jgi:endonuclease/exonuclease/phosphatase (EEP) superfamily protein YafD